MTLIEPHHDEEHDHDRYDDGRHQNAKRYDDVHGYCDDRGDEGHEGDAEGVESGDGEDDCESQRSRRLLRISSSTTDRWVPHHSFRLILFTLFGPRASFHISQGPSLSPLPSPLALLRESSGHTIAKAYQWNSSRGSHFLFGMLLDWYAFGIPRILLVLRAAYNFLFVLFFDFDQDFFENSSQNFILFGGSIGGSKREYQK